MVNFGPLAAEIGSLVWGIPANFNGFRILTAFTRHPSSERQPNFMALNRRLHLYSALGRAVIALSIGPHSSSLFFLANARRS